MEEHIQYIYMFVKIIVGNELVVEDLDPTVILGQEATMVFRTRLPYDTCIFTTPQVGRRGHRHLGQTVCQQMSLQ